MSFTDPRTPTIDLRPIISRAAAVAAVAALAIPTAAAAAQPHDRGSAAHPKEGASAAKPDSRTGYEKRYLDVRHDFVDANGVRAAGRNIVRHGYLEHDGDVHAATRAEIERSIATMNPPAVVTETAVPTEAAPAAEAASGATTEPTYSGGAAASSSTAQCESGGDYGAVNPAGYYGAYQFDQGTWDAYAPEGYGGVNPATAPPEVQDAAAAAVPYDAWPNC